MSELRECPGCGSESIRVIGGPGTAGGPKHWVGCDYCCWRTWGDTAAEAIAAWNTRASDAVADELERRADAIGPVTNKGMLVDPLAYTQGVAFGLREAAALVRQSSPATAREVEELRAEVERDGARIEPPQWALDQVARERGFHSFNDPALREGSRQWREIINTAALIAKDDSHER